MYSYIIIMPILIGSVNWGRITKALGVYEYNILIIFLLLILIYFMFLYAFIQSILLIHS